MEKSVSLNLFMAPCSERFAGCILDIDELNAYLFPKSWTYEIVGPHIRRNLEIKKNKFDYFVITDNDLRIKGILYQN